MSCQLPQGLRDPFAQRVRRGFSHSIAKATGFRSYETS